MTFADLFAEDALHVTSGQDSSLRLDLHHLGRTSLCGHVCSLSYLSCALPREILRGWGGVSAYIAATRQAYVTNIDRSH
jgi:hypothetical protein